MAAGFGALVSNDTGDANTAVGSAALSNNTTGTFNIAVGYASLVSNTTASYNTAVGRGTLLSNTTGASNVAVGDMALASNTVRPTNVAVGPSALQNNTVGSGNVALGVSALLHNSTGVYNVGIGLAALAPLTSGDSNVALGYAAGFNVVSGSNNIFLSSQGVAGDNGVMRIGTPGTQVLAFIAGIRGTTTSLNDAIPVVIDSACQLGTVSSSARVKDEIRDMAEESDGLLRLRPVTFRYKGQASDGRRQFGLIAEEVAEVLPELVVRNRAGEIETVKYHELPAMLLNELQKMERRAEAAEEALKVLEKRLARLEAAAGPAAANAGR